MTQQTSELLEKLADKLGTTSEYLWSVLLKQAPYDAMMQLIYFATTIVAGFVLWRVHKFLMKPLRENANDPDAKSRYAEFDHLPTTVMMILAVAWVVVIIICIAQLKVVISGFFNPEYWALDHILKLFKK